MITYLTSLLPLIPSPWAGSLLPPQEYFPLTRSLQCPGDGLGSTSLTLTMANLQGVFIIQVGDLATGTKACHISLSRSYIVGGPMQDSVSPSSLSLGCRHPRCDPPVPHPRPQTEAFPPQEDRGLKGDPRRGGPRHCQGQQQVGHKWVNFLVIHT